MKLLMPISNYCAFVINGSNKHLIVSSIRKWPGVRVYRTVLSAFSAAAVGFLTSGAPSQAQAPGFACSKAGTTAQYELGKLQDLGTSPDDPNECMLVDPWGKTKGLLFNYYGVEKTDYPAIRSAMTSLFSKRSQSVSFLLTSAGSRNQFRDTWTFLRKESIMLGDRKIDADVYENHRQGQLGNDWDGTWVLWLDPRTGIWVKRSLSLASGTAQGLGGQLGKLISIVDP
jgi:hypothetical protein